MVLLFLLPSTALIQVPSSPAFHDPISGSSPHYGSGKSNPSKRDHSTIKVDRGSICHPLLSLNGSPLPPGQSPFILDAPLSPESHLTLPLITVLASTLKIPLPCVIQCGNPVCSQFPHGNRHLCPKGFFSHDSTLCHFFQETSAKPCLPASVTLQCSC